MFSILPHCNSLKSAARGAAAVVAIGIVAATTPAVAETASSTLAGPSCSYNKLGERDCIDDYTYPKPRL